MIFLTHAERIGGIEIHWFVAYNQPTLSKLWGLLKDDC